MEPMDRPVVETPWLKKLPRNVAMQHTSIDVYAYVKPRSILVLGEGVVELWACL
jgi:hypothetical protein